MHTTYHSIHTVLLSQRLLATAEIRRPGSQSLLMDSSDCTCSYNFAALLNLIRLQQHDNLHQLAFIFALLHVFLALAAFDSFCSARTLLASLLIHLHI